VGVTVLGEPNSFLCTEKTYSDFILELEFRLDEAVNSGVQIRSNSSPDRIEGFVHGYQVEIDPSERAWTGGIYEEGGRAWLQPVENENARKAFHLGQWNRLRVEAIGDTLKTWVNEIPVSHLIDDRTREGFIGLQVHNVGADQKSAGLKVLWRDIRIITREPEKYAR